MTTFVPKAGRMLSCQDARTRATRFLLAVGSVLAVSLPMSAFAQTAPVCGPDIKEEVAKALSAAANTDAATQLSLEKQLYARYSFCLPVGQTAPPDLVAAARQCGATISQLGSIFFEEMTCAGYDPQRRQFAAPIKIKQIGGFGGAPLPGSREHVLHCVADPGGTYRPVGHDSVHLANAPGQVPTWQFAVIAAANNNLGLVQPMNGQTRRARSILSWAFTPTDCYFTPIWGNAVNYRIRLDQ